ncbi:hypothetical protein [Oceanobacillus saliphilus]|uniref:hypothetical protein n=1 Tax=Oceanobacillus saliphilus TaxID=2925834 RepID=UPI00201D93DB|nr:hypothetical protein [Oceanobacillus saliphilus]
MNALKKEDVFNDFDNLIKSLSKEEKQTYVDKVKRIKEKVEKLLSEEEYDIYNGIINESLKETWDNKKDDAYNDL